GLRFCLIENGLIRAWVDREKQIAFLHLGAVLEMARDDHTSDLRLYLHGLVSCTGTDFIQVKRYILRDDFSDACRTRSGLSSFNFRGSVLINSVGDKPCQQDEQQIRPLGNCLIRSAGSLRFGPGGTLGKAVIHDFLIAYRRINFHFDPLRMASFLEIESPRLVSPLWSANRRAPAFSPRARSLSLFSARSLIRVNTSMHI